MNTTQVAVDIAKSVFQVAVSHEPGQVHEQHRLSRARFQRFFANYPPAEVLMEAYGTKKSDFKLATELTSTEQSKALCDGKIDAYGYTVGVPNAGVSVATDDCDARIINLASGVEKKLVNENPYYAFATIPSGTYKTSASDVTTFGVMATFVTSADTNDDLVYEVVRAVMENIEDFRKLHPAFANLDPKRMMTNGLSAPLHAGAVKYYKEKGWK